jgi:hypothetical protein
MKNWKSFCGKFLLGVLGVILLITAINAFDVAVKPEVQELLQVSTGPNPQDDKVCAAALGLFVSESLDFQQEGHRLLQSLQVEFGDAEALVKAEAVEIPNQIEIIERAKKCDKVCVYTAEEKASYRKQLDQQRVFLERFKQLVQMESLQCRHPMVLIKFPILAFFRIAKNQILEFELLGQAGEVEKARQGLLQINHFMEKTLLREKYSVVSSLIFLSILERAREVFRSFEDEKDASKVSFATLKFDDVAKKTMAGELQFGQWLMSFHLKRDYLAISDINDVDESDDIETRETKQDMLDKLMFYFFSPKETINDNLTAITTAMWDPCIGQTDIPCKGHRPNPLTWVRNPIGKSMTDVLTNNLPEFYRKMKTRIDRVNKI